jgi:hypothetical protein
LPEGTAPLKKVRIYRRHNYYILQWWEGGSGRTQCHRVNGDLIAAITEARNIDTRLQQVGSSGRGHERVTHEELVERFLADAELRATAGSIAPKSVDRFRSALRHYREFVSRTDTRRLEPQSVNREFAMQFSAWLRQQSVAPNGRGAKRHPMRSTAIVLDIVRAMYEWAADPQRGGLMPLGFGNPFRRSVIHRRAMLRDILGEPDITVPMASEFLRACDPYQLKLFAPLLLWGPRPTELIWMFAEHVDDSYLRLNCIEQLNYTTKGLRNKALPWLPCLRSLLLPQGQKGGLLLLRRSVAEGVERPPLLGSTLIELIHEYRNRCAKQLSLTAGAMQRVRDEVLHDAGSLSYKCIDLEFRSLANRLGWPRTATLKDFRHLAQTCLDNGGLSREQRQFLLGQSMGRAAINHYLHLNQFALRYTAAVTASMQALLDVIKTQIAAAGREVR